MINERMKKTRKFSGKFSLATIRFLIVFITIGMAFFNLAQAQTTSYGEIEGIWEGTLRFSGIELRIIFTISRGPENRLAAAMDVPEQNAVGVPVDEIFFDGQNLTLKIVPIEGVFGGKLEEGGDTIDGQWTQSGMTLPLVLKRAETKLELNRPQEPKEPFSYKAEEVTFENTEAGITLAGTLTLPPSDGPFPAVLLLSGSGPQDRDESVFGHRPFLVLADYLTRRGIAVLRFDDRGVGGSTGNFNEAMALDYAADAMAGVAYLKSRGEIKHKQVGLIGHSEGGMIASMAAVQSPDIAFIVLMASPGLPIEKMEYSKQSRTLKVNGASDDLIARNRALQEKLFTLVRQEMDPQAVQGEFTSVITKYFEGLSEEERKITGISEKNLETYINDQFRRLHSPWFRFYLSYDPRSYDPRTTLEKVTCPVLAINGGKDIQVPPEENLQAIEKALKAGKSKNYKIKEFPELNHLFQTAGTGRISEYGKIEETMSPEALQMIGDWILERTGLR